MVMSTVSYVSCLLISTVVYKTILVVYEFPSFEFLALFRILLTMLILGIGRRLQFINFPSLNRKIVVSLLPLTVLHCCPMVTRSMYKITITKQLAAVGHRFAAVVTMVLEELMLGTRSPRSLHCSIVVMLLGAIISAANHLHQIWDWSSIMILFDIVIFALDGVYLKKILNTGDLNIWGLLYYDGCFMIVPNLIGLGFMNSERLIETDLYDSMFWWHVLLMCLVEIIVTFSMTMCTRDNSALTVAALTNLWCLSATYLKIILLGRGSPTRNMYVGCHMSLIGAAIFVYSNFTFKRHMAVEKILPATYDIKDITKMSP